MTNHDHTVTIEWNADGWETTSLNCHAPTQSHCHAQFDCECDYWPDLTITNGQPSHSAHWDDDPERHHGTLDPATCNLRDWFEATEEPIRGSITFPVRPEFDNDHYLFHVDGEAAS